MHVKRKTILRYILFQLPELTLILITVYLINQFFDFPSWILWSFVAFSIIKDILLFKKTWPSYVVHSKEEYSNVIGKTGLAVKDIEESGYININGELWKVEVSGPVKKGQKLFVKSINGLKLKAEIKS